MNPNTFVYKLDFPRRFAIQWRSYYETILEKKSIAVNKQRVKN